jgi:anti-sigma factor RsiW
MRSHRTDKTAPCASFRRLADHVEGRLDPEDRARLEAHLSRCGRCARELRVLEEVVEIMRADQSIEPPASVTARAVHLFRPEPLHERVRAWLADRVEELGHLVFDSNSQLAFAAARGVLAGRRLRFESAGLELDVLVEGRAGGARITGQVIRTVGEPRPLTDARFMVMAGTRPAAEGATDALGEFTADLDLLDGIRILVVDGERVVSFTLPPTLTDPDDGEHD